MVELKKLAKELPTSFNTSDDKFMHVHKSLYNFNIGCVQQPINIEII